MSESPFLLISLIGLMYIYLSQITKTKLKDRFNQPVFSTIYGAVVAIFYYIFQDQLFSFDHQFQQKVFTLFLPLIMVDAALKVNKATLIQNSYYILSYGIIGTLLNYIGMFFVLFSIEYFLDVN